MSKCMRYVPTSLLPLTRYPMSILCEIVSLRLGMSSSSMSVFIRKHFAHVLFKKVRSEGKTVYEDVWGSRSAAPRILNLCTR
jgi:hypothetical protein